MLHCREDRRQIRSKRRWKRIEKIFIKMTNKIQNDENRFECCLDWCEIKVIAFNRISPVHNWKPHNMFDTFCHSQNSKLKSIRVDSIFPISIFTPSDNWNETKIFLTLRQKKKHGNAHSLRADYFVDACRLCFRNQLVVSSVCRWTNILIFIAHCRMHINFNWYRFRLQKNGNCAVCIKNMLLFASTNDIFNSIEGAKSIISFSCRAIGKLQITCKFKCI